MGHPGVTFELEVRFAGDEGPAALVKRELQAWLAEHEVTAVVDGFVDGINESIEDAPPSWTDDELDATPLLIYGTLPELERLRQQLTLAFGGRIALRQEALADEAWQGAWRQEFNGLSTRRFVVAPPHAAVVAESGKHALVMTGGGAFGGGDHATTEVMLLALEDLAHDGLLTPPVACLDLGTGTGVLAIAAAKLGVSEVVATDLDPSIIDEAAANAAANAVSIDLRVTDAVPDGSFQLIMANILVPVLHTLAPAIVQRLAPGGSLLLAGFIGKDAPALIATYEALGLRVVHERAVRGWLALTLRAV